MLIKVKLDYNIYVLSYLKEKVEEWRRIWWIKIKDA